VATPGDGDNMNAKLTPQRFNAVMLAARRAGITHVLPLTPSQVAALCGSVQLTMSHPKIAEWIGDLPQLRKVYADLRDMMIGMGFTEEEIK